MDSEDLKQELFDKFETISVKLFCLQNFSLKLLFDPWREYTVGNSIVDLDDTSNTPFQVGNKPSLGPN